VALDVVHVPEAPERVWVEGVRSEILEVDVVDLESSRPLNQFGCVSSHVFSSLPTAVMDRESHAKIQTPEPLDSTDPSRYILMDRED
jgi:hypothetical protein